MTTLRNEPTAKPSRAIATISGAMAASFPVLARAEQRARQHADRYAVTAVVVVATEPPTLLW